MSGLYSICMQETPVRWLASVKKQTTATHPRYAKTFDKVEADRIVAAFKRLGFKQEFIVVDAPPEAL